MALVVGGAERACGGAQAAGAGIGAMIVDVQPRLPVEVRAGSGCQTVAVLVPRTAQRTVINENQVAHHTERCSGWACGWADQYDDATLESGHAAGSDAAMEGVLGTAHVVSLEIVSW